MKKGKFKIAIISLVVGLVSLCTPLIASNFGGGVHLSTLGGKNTTTVFSSGVNGQNSGCNDTQKPSINEASGEIAGSGIAVSPEIFSSSAIYSEKITQNTFSSRVNDNNTAETGLIQSQDDLTDSTIGEDDLLNSGIIKDPSSLDTVAVIADSVYEFDESNCNITELLYFTDGGTHYINLNGQTIIGSSGNGMICIDNKTTVIMVNKPSGWTPESGSVADNETLATFIPEKFSGYGIYVKGGSALQIGETGASSVNIKFDGQKESNRRFWYIYGGSHLIINGGIFTGARSGSIIHWSYLAINAGTITDNSSDNSLFLVYGNSNIVVNGGTFSENYFGGTNEAVAIYVGDGVVTEKIAVGVDFKVEKPQIVIQGDYTLTEDITLEGRMTIATSCTLDLAGHTITVDCPSTTWYDCAIQPLATTVTITDNVGGGKIIGVSENVTSEGIIIWDAGTTLTIDGNIRFSGFYHSIYQRRGSLIINNATFDGSDCHVGIHLYVAAYDLSLTINGGTFTNFHGANSSFPIRFDSSNAGKKITLNLNGGTFSNNTNTKYGNTDIGISSSESCTLNIKDGVNAIINDVYTKESLITPIATAQTVEYGSGGSFTPTGTDGNGNTITDGYTVKYRKAGESGDWSTTVPTALGTYDVYLYRAKTSSNSTVSRVLSSALVVEPQKVAVPTLSATSFTYNGGVQKPTITYDANIMTATYSNASSQNAGTYNVIFALKDKTNYTWSDGTTADKTVSYTINKATNEITSLIFNDWIYGGTPSTPQITATFGQDNVTYTYKRGSTVLSSLDNLYAGEYTITATIPATDCYTEATLTQIFVVEKKAVTLPTIGNLVYNGKYQEATIPGTELYGAFKMQSDSRSGGTNVGEYLVYVQLKDYDNYKWESVQSEYLVPLIEFREDSVDDVSESDLAEFGVIRITYKITKATTNNVTISCSDFIYGAYSESANKITATADFGTPKIVITNASGTVMTNISTANAGTYTITATVDATDNYVGNTVTKTLTIEKASVTAPTLEKESFTYTGSEITPTINNGTQDGITVSGGKSATNVGDYTITFTLDSNHKWADNTTSAKTLTWSITAKEVTVPTVSGTYTYNKSSQTLVLNNYNESIMSITGNTGTNAGNYTAKVTLTNSNYKWATTFNGNISWSIAKVKVTQSDLPTIQTASFVFDNTSHNITLNNEKSYLAVEGTKTAKNVGTYTLTISISDTTNYEFATGVTNTLMWNITKGVNTWTTTPSITGWVYGEYSATENAPKGKSKWGTVVFTYRKKGSTETISLENIKTSNVGTYELVATVSADGNNYDQIQKVLEFTISQKELTKPTLKTPTSVIYDTAEHTFTVEGFSASTMTQTGDNLTQTNVGSYSVTIALKNSTNYCWVGGGTDSFSLTFEILPAKLTKPTASITTFAYDGKAKELTLTGFDTTTMTKSGDSGTNANSYTATIKLNDTANYTWSDGTVDDVTIAWSITKATIEVPTISNFTYNGKTQKPTFSDSRYTVTENAGGTNVGSYSVKLKVTDEVYKNYKWATSDTQEITVNYAITKFTTNEITNLAIDNWTFGEASKTPSAKVTYGEIKYYYVTRGESSYTEANLTAPTNAGEYTLIAVVVDNTNYNGDTKTVNFEITKATVTVPTKTDKTYTYTGADQTLELNNFDSTLMNITGSVGKDAGNYTAVVTLIDPDNYKWKTTFDGNISWRIGKATNSFTQTIVTGWSGDEDPKVPTITAKFGAVVLTYKVVGSDTETETIPSAVGSYKVIARVTETTNYTGLEQEFDLNITSKSNSITDLTITGWTYGNYNAETNKPTASAKEGTIKYYYVGVGETVYSQSETVPTDAGTYKVLAIVEGTSEYAGASAEKEFTIEKAEVGESDKPTIVGGYTYNQTTQNVKTTTAPTYMTLGGSLSGENAGDYTITITLDNNHKWAEGVSNTISWTIQKGQAVINSLTISGWTYGDSKNTPEISTNFTGYTIKYYYEGEGYKKSETAPQNAGTYTLTAEIVGTDNYNGVTSAGVTFTIAPKTITAPSKNANTFTYTGSNQTYLENGTDYTVENGTQKDAGNYNVIVKLNDKVNFVWSTGGTEDITFTFIINKAEFSVPTAGAKQYTGKTLKSDLVDTSDYSVTQNDGGTEIGKYDVKLKLTDEKFKNYKWKDYAEDIQEITIKFSIIGTTNSWKTNPSIADFEYGSFNETINAPKGEALFGDVTFEFFIKGADGNKTGEALTLEQIKTADAGNYIMVATVQANEGVYDELRKEVPFTILKKKLTAPTKADKTYTYIKNTPQTLELDTNFDGNIMEITGNIETSAGSSYKAIITIKEAHQKNYEWIGGDSQIEINWEISKQKLTIPTKNASQNLTYTGNEISLELDNFDRELMEIVGNTGTNVSATGYTAIVTLKDDSNYEWNGEFDGNIEWNIPKAQAEITNLTITGWTYGGNSVSPSAITNFGTIDYIYEGVDGTDYPASSSVPTNAGKYKVIAKVSGSDNWNEATEKTQFFEISKKQVSKPAKDTTTFVFNGNPQTYQIASSEYYTISDNTTQTNADDYTITISLKDKENYIWEGTENLSDDLTYAFKIEKLKVENPAENTTKFVYTGTEQTYMADGEHYTVVGGKRTDAGSQTVTISLKDTNNTKWADGGIDDISYTFTISKAEVKIEETQKEITDGESGEFSVSDELLPENVGVKVEYAPTGTEDWSENVPQAVGSYDVKLTFTVSSESVNYKSSEQVIRTGFVVKQKAIAPVDDKEPTMVEKEKHAVQIGLIVSAVSVGLIVLTIIIIAMRHHYLKKDCNQKIKDYYIEHPDEIPEDFPNKEDKKKKKKTKTNK